MATSMKTYSPKELPAVLHLGMTSIYRMIRCGEIAAARVGGSKLVVTQAEVDRLLTPPENIRKTAKKRKS